jgi:hypothetical protein
MNKRNIYYTLNVQNRARIVQNQRQVEYEILKIKYFQVLISIAITLIVIFKHYNIQEIIFVLDDAL